MADPYPKLRRQVRERVQMQRRGRWAPKLDAKRQERRETRASWAVRGKEREPACRRCGNWIWLESHHMYARGVSGGAKIDEDWNHITLCAHCHDRMHLHRIEAQALGLLAHAGDASPWPRTEGHKRGSDADD